MIYLFYAYWLEKIILELLSYLMAFWLNTHADSGKKEERKQGKKRKNERKKGGRKKEGIKERKLFWRWFKILRKIHKCYRYSLKFGWMYSLTSCECVWIAIDFFFFFFAISKHLERNTGKNFFQDTMILKLMGTWHSLAHSIVFSFR